MACTVVIAQRHTDGRYIRITYIFHQIFAFELGKILHACVFAAILLVYFCCGCKIAADGNVMYAVRIARAHKNAACRLSSAFSHCMAAMVATRAAATLVVLAVVAMTNGVQTASEFPTTSNHTEQCRYQIDCGENGYAPILAFCVIRHATTHVRQNAIYI